MANRGPGLLKCHGSIRKALSDVVRGVAASSLVAAQAMRAIPEKQRAGYPLVQEKGAIDPRGWKTEYGAGVPVFVDFGRRPWLPDTWCQGIKKTKGGNTYTVYMPPTEMRTFYHKWEIEAYLGRALTTQDGFRGQLRLAALQQEQAPLDSNTSFFKLLSRRERAHLPERDAFHFCIVSARRAQLPEGARDIATVQTAFLSAGVEPTWYVDEASLEAYRALGLRAVVGGRLTPARNRALADARRLGKACVQCSDDLSAWEYRVGEPSREKTLDAYNAAHKAARRYAISPVAAARFVLAKMRGIAEGDAPRLGGAYILGDCSRTWGSEEYSRKSFILGDFFIDDDSGLLFDERLTLKEDYDFCAQHIHTYGSVLRCNRMTFTAKHYSNPGGAVDNRDAKGLKEQENMAILFRKWPSAIFPHGRRANEVRLHWPMDNNAKEPKLAKRVHTLVDLPKDELVLRYPGRLLQAAEALVGGHGQHKDFSAGDEARKATPPVDSVLHHTGKQPAAPHMVRRCKKVAGLTVGQALTRLRIRDVQGNLRAYRPGDLRYDLHFGYLSLT